MGCGLTHHLEMVEDYDHVDTFISIEAFEDDTRQLLVHFWKHHWRMVMGRIFGSICAFDPSYSSSLEGVFSPF